MKDRFFKYFEVLVKNPKTITAILVLMGFGGYQTVSSSEKDALLKAEKGALKIYADMAYNCPNVEKSPLIRHNDTRYIDLMDTHLKDYH